MRVLILGVSGLIGSTLFRVLSKSNSYRVGGTLRLPAGSYQFEGGAATTLYFGVDFLKSDRWREVITDFSPDVVVNCAGVTKHRLAEFSGDEAHYINAQMPVILKEELCKLDSRFVQISTDCVFRGERGNYIEEDQPDALDRYGRTKIAGEVRGRNVLTIRTSTIGHECGTKHGLLEWFMDQKDSCRGFERAVFSGMPTLELACIFRDYILPGDLYGGLFHLAPYPINKLALLQKIAKHYQLDLEIIPDQEFEMNRVLNSQKFLNATNYRIKDWDTLIIEMRKDWKENYGNA